MIQEGFVRTKLVFWLELKMLPIFCSTITCRGIVSTTHKLWSWKYNGVKRWPGWGNYGNPCQFIVHCGSVFQALVFPISEYLQQEYHVVVNKWSKTNTEMSLEVTQILYFRKECMWCQYICLLKVYKGKYWALLFIFSSFC